VAQHDPTLPAELHSADEKLALADVAEVAEREGVRSPAVVVVGEVVRITAPYKLVSSENNARRSTVSVGGVPIGGHE